MADDQDGGGDGTGAKDGSLKHEPSGSLAGQANPADFRVAERIRHAERALEKMAYAAKHGLGFAGQAHPPDPLEEQAQAWRLYGAFLDTARMCRDAFVAAKLDLPNALDQTLIVLGQKD